MCGFFLPPKNEHDLINKARKLAGYTMLELAYNAKIKIPINLKYQKGWVGRLLEYYLGVNINNKTDTDFPNIGVELKSIPIDYNSEPLETTFVCLVSLIGNNGINWISSYIRYKLSKVLWFPIEGNRDIPLIKRRVGYPFIWSPNQIEEQLIKNDWEELMDMIVLGYVESITAHYGQVLQIRPKALNSKVLTKGIGKYGESIFTQPRGFYLKKKFTKLILNNYFNLYN